MVDKWLDGCQSLRLSRIHYGGSDGESNIENDSSLEGRARNSNMTLVQNNLDALAIDCPALAQALLLLFLSAELW